MKISWQIEETDINEVKALIAKHEAHQEIKRRRTVNLSDEYIDVSQEDFWYMLVMALLTSQQRSSPTSPISQFLNQEPFPLRLSVCVAEKNLVEYATAMLSDFGGIRYYNKISSHLAENLMLLDGNLWATIKQKLEAMQTKRSKESERETADFVAAELKGIGPKQSRNILQALGLTRYEIPLDSRIMKWLNRFGFPIQLSSEALSDLTYYHFIEDGVQALCTEVGEAPCILDAAIFVSFDDK